MGLIRDSTVPIYYKYYGFNKEKGQIISKVTEVSSDKINVRRCKTCNRITCRSFRNMHT